MPKNRNRCRTQQSSNDKMTSASKRSSERPASICNRDTKPAEKPTGASGATDGCEPQPAQPQNGGKNKSQGQQMALGSDAATSRQNALERLRKMEWQRNKGETHREQVELHALPPKRDFAAEEANASSDETRGKSKGRNRRRCRQLQQQESASGDKPQLVAVLAASPLPPFPEIASCSRDVTPFWRSSKPKQEDGRTPFPSRVNVWLQRPGVDLFPKLPAPESMQQKDDALASATEESMLRIAVVESLKTAEVEGTILLPRPPRSTKSPHVQPPPLENEDWEADINDETASSRATAEQSSENGTEKQVCQEKVDVIKISEQLPAGTKTENISSSSMSPDHKSLPDTDNNSKRFLKNDNRVTSWYQSSTKERPIKSKVDGKSKNPFYTQEKNSVNILEWKKPTQKSEVTTDWQGKNSQNSFQSESVNNKNASGIYRESQVSSKDTAYTERWRSDWRDRRNNFDDDQSNVQKRNTKDTNGKYTSNSHTSTDLQAPKEQRTEAQRTNRTGAIQCSVGNSQQETLRDSEALLGSNRSTDQDTGRSSPFRNDIASLKENKTRENNRTVVEENSKGIKAERDHLNSIKKNSFQSSSNGNNKPVDIKNISVSLPAHSQTASVDQVEVIPRAAVWNAETGNSSNQYEEKLLHDRNTSQHKHQQQDQLSKREAAPITEKTYDKRNCKSPLASVSSPPGLKGQGHQRNEQISKCPESTVKETSESKPSERESSVDEFFRKYAQHNSASGQSVRLPDGSLPMGAFKMGGSAPSLGMQPNCAPAPVIQGAAGIPSVHPNQIRVCSVPQMYQPCGVLPDMGTALQYSTYPYVDGTVQRPVLESHAVLQSNSDCCPGAAPQSSTRYVGNGGQRPAVVPVTLSSQSPEAYSSYGLGGYDGGQQAFSTSHLGGVLKGGTVTGYGAISGTSPIAPMEVMLPGLGASHPGPVPPPPGVFAFPAVGPLTNVSPPRCSQLQQGLVLQPLQMPQENLNDVAVGVVQDAQENQVHSNATQVIPQVHASGVSQNPLVSSGNSQTSASQDSSHTILNRNMKLQMPHASITNPSQPPMLPYSPGQPNDMSTFLSLQQNGIADSPDAMTVAVSQWPFCCFSQTDLAQLQGMPPVVNPDGTLSHFSDMTHLGMPPPFKQPSGPLVDHIWYPGVPPLLPVHDSVNMCRNNVTKQFGAVPDMRADSQATMLPQVRGLHPPLMSQLSLESQQANDPSQIYLTGIGHIPTQTQLHTPSVSALNHSSVPSGLPPQLPLAQGAVQQQIGLSQHPPGIGQRGMCQNANNPATSGNSHRIAVSQAGTAAVSKGRIVSESTVSDTLSVDSKQVQKMPRVQSSQESHHTFPDDGNRADVTYVTGKMRQSSLTQGNVSQGIQTGTPQGTFHSGSSVPTSAPKAQLYYEKVQSLLCQPPDVVSRLLQQMQLTAGITPVPDPSAGTAVGPQGFAVPPGAEVWPVVHNTPVAPGHLLSNQSQGVYAVAARGRSKGRGRLRDNDG